MTNYIYCCAYYYLTAAMRTAAYTLAVLTTVFIIHKLTSWALWVMSL